MQAPVRKSVGKGVRMVERHEKQERLPKVIKDTVPIQSWTALEQYKWEEHMHDVDFDSTFRWYGADFNDRSRKHFRLLE